MDRTAPIPLIVSRFAVMLALLSVGLSLLMLGLGQAARGSVISFLSTRRADYHLYLMDIRQNVTYRVSDQSFAFGSPVWSPDGKAIVSALRLGERFGAGLKLYQLPMNARTPRLIATTAGGREYMPAWSPDSQQVAYVYLPEPLQDRELAVIDLQTGMARALTDNAIDDLMPNWSPDGETIVFMSQHEDTTSLYTVNANGDNLTRLTHEGRYDRNPVFSPDGSYILFMRYVAPQWDIYLMRPDGSSIRRLTSTPEQEITAVWSPDSTQIAFVSQINNGEADIYAINTDGSGLRRITFNNGYSTLPIWSPDGKQILFLAGRGSDADIWVVNADGGSPRRLTDNHFTELAAAWRP